MIIFPSVGYSAKRSRTAVAAESGVIAPDRDGIDAFALGLRYTVAVSVGAGITLGVLRILKGWPLHWLIIGGYLVAVALSLFAPEEIIGIAFDKTKKFGIGELARHSLAERK